ncbi:hypothetical protein GRI89_09335 [Altererythrobacter salegens]|uniref:DUF4440 domain-containing protein n=1 Tax=Croceibacterium salegens TaxID=1737568 RepID=A0A6I4SX86_9SPHN|nr:hypothetical protein [Croceibacterium salegens]MXO59740.1 hypothetical protein [Croceibacterium salegens]
MRRIAALALLAGACACIGAPAWCGSGGRSRDLRPVANPSEVIATELAFARLAQEKGQWAAFREYADKDAQMFVPQPVEANNWLKSQEEPAQAVTWQPHAVWSSCDGEYAITEGAWQRPSGTGWFSTVWKRQRNGEYKWVLDQGGNGDAPIPAGEFIKAEVGSCENKDAITAPTLSVPTGDTKMIYGESTDKTLRWITRVEADGSRYYAFEYWDGQQMQRPIAENVPAE